MPKFRLKPCDLCSQLVDIRYRIRYDASARWVLVCFHCWEKVNQDNPFYLYGGTWKAKK